MDSATLLQVFEHEASEMASLEHALLGKTVPGCPDWTSDQLIGHTGWVYRFALAALKGGGEAPDRSHVQQAPTEDLYAWFIEGFAALRDRLRSADPTSAPIWTFAGPADVAWWIRRMAQETAVHHWDARSALGAPSPIAAEVAADGIDEALDVMMPRRFDHGAFDAGTTVHLHATDHDAGEWVITLSGSRDGMTWERAHRKSDVAVRGPVSDLLVWFYGRIPTSALDVAGDSALADRFSAAATF